MGVGSACRSKDGTFHWVKDCCQIEEIKVHGQVEQLTRGMHAGKCDITCVPSRFPLICVGQ